jgi:hypothetical protein
MVNSQGNAAHIRQAVVIQTLLDILANMVTFRTGALVIVDQILATAWKACALWTVWNISTDSGAVIADQFFEAGVADALVVIFVLTGGLCRIDTFPMRSTQVALAIVHVLASIVDSDVSRGLALRAECDSP